MKIAFLCSSLAAGRNGVGDYVRLLAGALEDEGHCCRLFALHERQPDGDEDPARFSASLPWARRAELLAAALGEFDPDVVSWQLVPYGFHPKGILPRGVQLLADAARRWPQHVMLHELWIGLAAGERWSAQLVGAWQRQRLLAFVRHLRPVLVHTSNASYQAALHAHGLAAERLPLFGNIPIVGCTAEEAESALAEVAGPALPPEPRWIAATFGTLHPQWHADETVAWLRAAAAAAGRRVALVAIGRIGAHGEALLDRLAREHPDIRFVTAGTRAPETISLLLHASDFGIATHPWALIDKSGGAAAMCEHGLPVLVARDDWHLQPAPVDEAPADPLLIRLGHLPPASAGDWLDERRAPASRLPAIATRFAAELATSLARPIPA